MDELYGESTQKLQNIIIGLNYRTTMNVEYFWTIMKKIKHQQRFTEEHIFESIMWTDKDNEL